MVVESTACIYMVNLKCSIGDPIVPKYYQGGLRLVQIWRSKLLQKTVTNLWQLGATIKGLAHIH